MVAGEIPGVVQGMQAGFRGPVRNAPTLVGVNTGMPQALVVFTPPAPPAPDLSGTWSGIGSGHLGLCLCFFLVRLAAAHRR